MDCSMQGFPVLHYLPDLLKFMSIELVMPSNQLIFYWPLLLLLSIIPSISAFSSELKLCARWPKYWGFSFSISPSNEYSGWIFFRIDWFDLLAARGALKSLFQHSSSKACINHGQRSLAGYSPWACKESRHDWATNTLSSIIFLIF